jgi:hypothetical protein
VFNRESTGRIRRSNRVLLRIAFDSSILAEKRARGEQDINREMIRSYQGDNRWRKSKTSIFVPGAKTAPDATKIAPEAA